MSGDLRGTYNLRASSGRSSVLSVRIPIVPQETKMQLLSAGLLDFNSSKSEILALFWVFWRWIVSLHLVV